MAEHTDLERLCNVEQAVIGLREEKKNTIRVMQEIQARQREAQAQSAVSAERFGKIETALNQIVKAVGVHQADRAVKPAGKLQEVDEMKPENITLASTRKMWQNTMGLNKVLRRGD